MPERENLEPWKLRWANGQTGWDQGQAHPELSRLVTQAQLLGELSSAGKIFSAGCGRAHNEAFLAGMGFAITAIDAVPKAIEEAKLIYGTIAKLELEARDVFEVVPEEVGAYDAIFDRAMLCAIHPSLREAYLESCKARLKPSGLFMSLLFREVYRAEGPPFAVDEAEAWRLFGQDFHLCYAAKAGEFHQPSAVKEEWICIWRKVEGGANVASP